MWQHRSVPISPVFRLETGTVAIMTLTVLVPDDEGLDVLAEVPPHDKDQIGSVMLRGKDNVRKWVDRIARTQVRLNYLMKRQTDGPTGDFEGWRLVYSTKLPWGGTGIAFQIIGAWSLREDRRRFTAPGSVFIQYGPDGKIRRLRLLLGEIDEVVPL